MKEITDPIVKHFRQLYDIDISKFDDAFLSRSILKRSADTLCDSPSSYCKHMEQNDLERKRFLDSLHIGYSEFFRNPLTFLILERFIIPEILLKLKNINRQEIRIWSAACAAGEEAYSLAMILEEQKHSNNGKWNYRIFASDISKEQIVKANTSTYSSETLNNMSLKRIRKWFTESPHDGLDDNKVFHINPDLKQNIEFSVFDLCDEQLTFPSGSIFGDFDIVICANFLFYYKTRYRKTILEKTGNALTNGGYLITGETERDFLFRNQYHEVFPESAIFRKNRF